MRFDVFPPNQLYWVRTPTVYLFRFCFYAVSSRSRLSFGVSHWNTIRLKFWWIILMQWSMQIRTMFVEHTSAHTHTRSPERIPVNQRRNEWAGPNIKFSLLINLIVVCVKNLGRTKNTFVCNAEHSRLCCRFAQCTQFKCAVFSN